MHAACLQEGPIDAPKTPADVRQEPYPLPDRWGSFHSVSMRNMAARGPALHESEWPTVLRSFEWSTCDVNDRRIVEEVRWPAHPQHYRMAGVSGKRAACWAWRMKQPLHVHRCISC